MPPVIGGFAINISAFTAGLRKGLAGARKMIGRFSSGIATATKRLAKFGAAAAAVVVGGLAALYSRNRNLIDDLGKTSDRLGIATEELQAFHLAASLAGTGPEKINGALTVMQKRLGEASAGFGTATKFLDLMGLSADELVRMAPDAQFRLIADSIAGLGTQAEKAAATAGIFSRANIDLLNLLEGGGGAIDAAREDIESFGGALSRVEVAQVEAANDAMTRLGTVIGVVSKMITVALAPYVEAVTEKLVAMASQGGGIRDVVGGAIKFLAKGFAFLWDIASRGIGVFKTIQGTVTLVLSGMIKMVALAARGIEKLLSLVGIDVNITETLDAVQEGLDELASEQYEAGIDRLIAPSKVKEVEDFFQTIQKKSLAAAKMAVETKDVTPSLSPPPAMLATAAAPPEAGQTQFAGAALAGSQAAASAILKATTGASKSPQVQEQKTTNLKLDVLIQTLRDSALGGIARAIGFNQV